MCICIYAYTWQGRLEALHAFQKDWWSALCGRRCVVSHAVGEPADLYHHDLEHRGSWGNVARRVAALCALTLVRGAPSARPQRAAHVPTLQPSVYPPCTSLCIHPAPLCPPSPPAPTL